MKPLRDDACGCAMGAVFMVIGLGASSIYVGWQYRTGDLGAWAAVLRVFLATFLAAGTGKVLGILRHRLGRNRLSAPSLPTTLDLHHTGD